MRIECHLLDNQWPAVSIIPILSHIAYTLNTAQPTYTGWYTPGYLILKNLRLNLSKTQV